MNELIIVNTNDNGEPTVSGRELHLFLRVKTAYKDWFPRMVEYGFTEGIDFCSFLSESTGGRPAIDHTISLDMAKEISMLQRNERGKLARQHFISIEKKWNTPEAVMARALKVADNTIAALTGKVSILLPKAEVYDTFIDRGHAIGFRELAKELEVKETVLRSFLIDEKIAYRQGGKWKPYAKSIKNGFMVVKDVKSVNSDFTGTQALFTMAGKEYISHQLIRGLAS